MEAVVALWDATHRIVLNVLGQANGAWAGVGLGQSPALSQYDLRVGLYCGPVQAQNHHHGLAGISIAAAAANGFVHVGGAAGNAAAVGLDADAGVGGEHDGGDEDEDADGDGDAIAEAYAGGGGRRIGGGHERERERIEVGGSESV